MKPDRGTVSDGSSVRVESLVEVSGRSGSFNDPSYRNRKIRVSWLSKTTERKVRELVFTVSRGPNNDDLDSYTRKGSVLHKKRTENSFLKGKIVRKKGNKQTNKNVCQCEC